MIKSQQAVVDVQPDTVAVAKRVSNWLIERLNERADRFSLCISGGQTPRLLYETLGQPEFADKIPWSKVHIFWGDERFVPKSDQLSNYKMVKTALLDRVQIPQANIHPVPTELGDSTLAAAAYEKDLQDFYGSKTLTAKHFLFDITLLGIGNDGHTASLFPGTEVLKEKTAWVKSVRGVKSEDRITLTIPVLESSRVLAFLVTGSDKSAILKQVMDGQSNLPAASIKPTGSLYWFLDQAAYLSKSARAT